MATVIYFLEMEKSIMLRNATAILTKVKRIQELRRSNAATPVRNKKKYTRKLKYKGRLDD